MRQIVGTILVIILIVLVAGAYWFSQANISALATPSRLEASIALRAKHWLIAKAARGALPAEPPATADNISDGQMYYGSLCAGCHGYDARTPTQLGVTMNPHAPSLAGRAGQSWSNAELYVIIHDGIRLSGMPGFGANERPDQIWALVHYVRSLPNGRPPAQAPAH